MTVPTRQEDPNRQFIERRTERHDPGPAILLVGSWRDDAFVPAEILICADTLSAEEAIRTWLAERDIHVRSSSSGTASRDNDLTEETGS